jgi:plastocyanin
MKLRPLVVLAAVTVPLLACGGGGDGGGGDAGGGGGKVVDVTIDTFQFSPDPLEVEAGTTVRFTNEDPTTHTVTAGTRKHPDPDRFDERLPEDGTAEITFDEPGRFPYFCMIHSGPGMTAVVVVT